MNAAFFGLILIICIEYVGLSSMLPILRILHFTLGLSAVVFLYVLSRNGVERILSYPQTKLFLIFLSLTFIALFHTIVKIYSVDVLKAQIGYFILFYSGFYLLNNFKKIELFALSFLTINLVITVINFSNFFPDMREGSFKAGYFLMDGNDFGWGLNIAIPFAFYFIFRTKSYFKKIAGLFTLGLLVFGVLGTLSRGAALAMGASLFYLILNSKQKSVGLILLIISVIIIFAIAPTSLSERMGTMKNIQSDNSATGRLIAWTAATKMAIDNPLLGVGAGNFSSAYGRIYLDEEAVEGRWKPMRWIAAHSVYFLVLGEYGFLGLFLFLYLIYHNFMDNYKTRKLILNNQENITTPHFWPLFLNMALMGYSVGGVFLGGINYPHISILTFLTLSTKFLVHNELEKNSSFSTSNKIVSGL